MFSEDLKFHHIGVAVYDIEETSISYRLLGFSCSDIILDSKQNVKIAWLKKEGSPLIELVAPIDEKSPVVTTLAKNGVGPYHVCYSVSDMNVTIQNLRHEKFIQVSKRSSAPAIEGKDVVFMYNKTVGLIEIVEL